MSRLLGIAHFTFHEGRFAEFTRLARMCQHIVATQDTGTLRYEVFVDRGESRAVVVEEYADEAALREHGEHIGTALSSAILATAQVHGEILGELSDGLSEQLADGPVTGFHPLFSPPLGGEQRATEEFTTSMATVAVRDLGAVTPFYETLFGRVPDLTPMPGLAQWDLPAGAAFQVVEDAERAGRSMATLVAPDLDSLTSRLHDTDVDLADIIDGVLSRLTQARDPDGNLVTIVESP